MMPYDMVEWHGAPFTAPPTAQTSTAPTGAGTLGTVDTEREREAAPSVARDIVRGPTKAYNVRLTMSLVAQAMDDPRSGDLSLAGLIDQLLEEFVERA